MDEQDLTENEKRMVRALLAILEEAKDTPILMGRIIGLARDGLGEEKCEDG